ncbi:MAG: hypothetical protein ABW098_16970, partial [Candidatus Thiodiazotropha sp.]
MQGDKVWLLKPQFQGLPADAVANAPAPLKAALSDQIIMSNESIVRRMYEVCDKYESGQLS